jgi:hypothetical protein
MTLPLSDWVPDSHGLTLVTAQAGVVQSWSTVRLGIGRTHMPWLRRSLSAALGALSAGPDQILHAVYASADLTVVDTEQVLFHHVGAACFAKAARHGLRFERSHEVPPPPRPEPGPTLHHHRYELAPRFNGWRHWHSGLLLSTFTDVPLTSLATITDVWRAIRDHTQPPDDRDTYHGPVAVRLALTPPTRRAPLPSAIGKALLDGTLAAFHSHDGTDVDELAARVGVRPIHLVDARWSVLGRRRLLWRHNTEAVQWNPADDRLVAAELLLDTRRADEWQLSGELRQVMPIR